MSRALLARVGKMERETGVDNSMTWFSWPTADRAEERDAMADEIRACTTRVFFFSCYDDEDSIPDDIQELIGR